MAFVTPILKDAKAADNTGNYEGYDIRVKGDGRVEARNNIGETAMHLNVTNAKHWIDTGGGAPAPEPGEEPTLTSLDPTSWRIGDPPVTMTATGTGFTDQSILTFNGGDEPTTFVSETELTTEVGTASTPGLYPVTVKQGSFETAPLDFDILPEE
jgi:hypothetical protein